MQAEMRQEMLSDEEFLQDLKDVLIRKPSVWPMGGGGWSKVHFGKEVSAVDTLFNTSSGEIYIGDYTFMGHGVSLITGTHDTGQTGKARMTAIPLQGRDIQIGNGVWIGSGSILLGPCEVGDNAVIGAGSVVLPGTKVAADEMWAGVPAGKKKELGYGYPKEEKQDRMTIKERIKNKIRPHMNAFIEEYTGERFERLNRECEESGRKTIELNERLSNAEENVRNLKALMEKNTNTLNTMEEEFGTVCVNIRNNNDTMAKMQSVLGKNNDAVEKMQSVIEMQKVKTAMLEKRISRPAETVTAAGHEETVQNITPRDQETGGVYNGIDYFDFENHFRGSMEQIRKNQMQYLKYFEGRSNVIDAGCGRGEFLELLKEQDIDAQGVDIYEEFVEMCRMKNLKVTCDDMLHFLRGQENVGGIFGGQVIEHLSTGQIVELCELAYDRLEEGAALVLETPNPTCLAIYTHAFYVDPSHQKPVHPLTMQYLMEKAGFKDIEVIYTKTSRFPVSIPALKVEQAENLEEFNWAMQVVSETLFGSQDYAIVGVK